MLYLHVSCSTSMATTAARQATTTTDRARQQQIGNDSHRQHPQYAHEENPTMALEWSDGRHDRGPAWHLRPAPPTYVLGEYRPWWAAKRASSTRVDAPTSSKTFETW